MIEYINKRRYNPLDLNKNKEPLTMSPKLIEENHADWVDESWDDDNWGQFIIIDQGTLVKPLVEKRPQYKHKRETVIEKPERLSEHLESWYIEHNTRHADMSLVTYNTNPYILIWCYPVRMVSSFVTTCIQTLFPKKAIAAPL
jgi:hypothetical protein